MIEVREVVETIDPKNVKDAIEAAGISGRELGRRLQAHGNLVTRIINGKRSHITTAEFDAIAHALAGEGDYRGHDSEAVKKVMRGQATFQRQLVERDDESVTAYVKSGDAVSLVDGYSIDKEEAPAEAGTSKERTGTTFGRSPGRNPQMSYYRSNRDLAPCAYIKWGFIPHRSRSRELLPALSRCADRVAS